MEGQSSQQQQAPAKKKETRGRKPKPKEEKKEDSSQSNVNAKKSHHHHHSSADDNYSYWKSVVPVLYDWLSNHNLVWPSLSCRFHRERLFDINMGIRINRVDLFPNANPLMGTKLSPVSPQNRPSLFPTLRF